MHLIPAQLVLVAIQSSTVSSCQLPLWSQAVVRSAFPFFDVNLVPSALLKLAEILLSRSRVQDVDY